MVELSGQDAERFVAYIDNPTPPPGHADFLRAADAIFAASYCPPPLPPPETRGGPRRPLRLCVTFGCVMLVLGLGDQAANWSHMPAAWTRTLWPRAHAGTLPRFHYTSASAYHDETVAGIPLRCRQYEAPGHIVVVCCPDVRRPEGVTCVSALAASGSFRPA